MAAQEPPTSTAADFHLLALRSPTQVDIVFTAPAELTGCTGTIDAFQVWGVWWAAGPLGGATEKDSGPSSALYRLREPG